MKRLFIDTHSEKVTIIYRDAEKLVKEEVVSNRSHSEVVVPTLESLLEEVNVKPQEIEEIIVVNGPGSFTGVRIGVTIAKTLAYSLSIPIKTITSLEMFGVSMSLEFDVVTVEDSKGVYSAKRENDEFIDMQYNKRSDFDNYVSSNNFKVLNEKIIDIDKIIEYVCNQEPSNPHLVNPIYIKEIDALK